MTTTNKTMRVVKNILIGLLALQFIGIGVMKVIMPIFGVDMFVKNMEGLNYNYAWTVFIGLIDLFGGIGLIFKKTRGYAGIALLFLLHGAVGSHITHNDPVSAIVGGAGVAMVLIVIVLLLDKPFGLIDKANNKTYFNN
jgi:putative oxidoreductase